MNDPEIDRILSIHDEIPPSSGFVASVMDAARREAVVPPPIPFPWNRALPGVVVAALALALVVVVGVTAIVQISRGAFSLRLAITPPSPPIWQGTVGSALAWTALALLVAFVSVKFSMRLVAGRT